MIDKVVPQLPKSHPFLWDRTRSIRQDFTYQNYSGPEAIECNELIARIHALSLHVMLTSDQEHSKQQELEQFNKTLQTLSELYDLNRKRNPDFRSPREPEFRSYLLLSHIHDPDIERQIQLLPQDIYDDPKIQNAIFLRGLMQKSHGLTKKDVKENSSNLFAALFQAVATDKSVSFLTSCLIESHFQDIRFGALGSMARAYHTRGEPYMISRLTKLLGFGNEHDTASFCKSYGLNVVENDQQNLAVNVAPTSLNVQTSFANFFAPYIDVKKGSKSWSSCIYDDSTSSIMSSSSLAFNRPAANKSPFQPLSSSPLKFPVQPSSSSTLFSNPALSQPSQQPKFTFGTTPAKPAFSLSTPASALPANGKPSLFSFNSPTITKEEQTAAPVSKPILVPTPAPPPPKPKPVIRYVYSDQDVQQESHRIIKEVALKSIHDLLPSVWREIKKKRTLEAERQKKIRALAQSAAIEQEFKSMVSQLVLEAATNAKADQMNASRLKSLAVRLISRAAFIASDLANQAARRKQEYDMVSRQLGRPRAISTLPRPSLKQPVFDNKSNHLTPEQRYELKLQDIKLQKEKSALFWKPLDVENIIANLLERGLRTSHTYGQAILQVSLFCQNWNTVVGKWLQTKMTLGHTVQSSSKATLIYVDQLQEDPQTYEEICQLILVTGLDSNGQPQSNVDYDKEALAAIISRVKDRSIYKLDLMVMHFGDDGASESAIFNQLGVQEHLQSLNSIVFCAMSGHADNPSDALAKSLGELASKFEGTLSVKGLKDKQAEQQRVIEERDRQQYEQYIEKVRQDEAERNRRLERIQKMNGLHIFDKSPQDGWTPVSPPVKKRRGDVQLTRETEGMLFNGATPPSSATKAAPVSQLHVSRSVRELQELIASINDKRAKTPTIA